MDFLPPAFAALDAYNQFIIYKLVPRGNKYDKIPLDYRTRQAGNPHDPVLWLKSDAAIAIAQQFGKDHGVGFVLTESDPFWFLDIDNCLTSSGTAWNDIAVYMCGQFNGAAVEISASNKGLHIIGSGTIPHHTCRNKQYNLEFYHTERFIALTGTEARGNAAMDCSAALAAIVPVYFASGASEQAGWTDAPCLTWRGPADDENLIERALHSHSSKSTFGESASFKAVWEQDIERLCKIYPQESGYNESSADAALAQHLAFWTGNNCERMLRLMQRSALVREKWQREDYLPRTILSACSRQREWCVDKLQEPVAGAPQGRLTALRPEPVQGNTYLTMQEQQTHFQGCVYVCDEHKVLIPGGYLLNSERFKVMFGGVSMPMDNKNERVTRNAWEAFTESQSFRAPRADSTCFRPDVEPGQLVRQDEQSLVNIYWPVITRRVMGDPAPFLDLLNRMLPDKNDQLILLSYLAAIVQYKGVKFQWCPVIQGVQGNGKTLLTRCIAYAIGIRYSHFPKAGEIDSKFNDWLYQRIFIGIEDIFVAEGRLQIMETMKPMVTSEWQEIEPKGGAKVTRNICANFLINSNHKDGLRKTENDRRFAPFYTAQQTVSDLKRDKMLGDFFPNIYRWLEKQDGYAIVNELLCTFEIPSEYNPAINCRRAPHTSSTGAAIREGMGNIEQEILECVAEGSPGFKNGWISSMALDRLLIKLNASRRIPVNKRRELLASVGYDWHPGLKDGRVTRIVMPDSGKPRLYIARDHAASTLQATDLITKAYEDAQK